MKRFVITLMVVCAGCASAVAHSAQARARGSSRGQIVSRLNRVISTIESLNVPGGVVGVTGEGIGSYQHAFGFAAPGVPMTARSEFRIASVTKTFTATVILELVDRGKLELSQRLDRWEPRLPYANVVTIAQLLNMTSSIYDEGGAGSLLVRWEQQNCVLFQPSAACSQTYWRPQSIVDLAIKQGAQYQPGVWNYSDTNYVLLAMIAQDVTHKPFWLLLKQLIFDPLHLRHTFFPTSSTAMPQPATAGYQLYPIYNTKGRPIAAAYAPGPSINPSLLFGAGAIVSNLADLERWARALATGALLKPRTQALRLELLQTNISFPPLAGSGFEASLPVTYGLGVASLGGMLGHNGLYGPLYSSELWYSPSRHGSVIVLFNTVTPCQGGQPLSDVTAATLARIAYGASLTRVGQGATAVACQTARPLGGSQSPPTG